MYIKNLAIDYQQCACCTMTHPKCCTRTDRRRPGGRIRSLPKRPMVEVGTEKTQEAQRQNRGSGAQVLFLLEAPFPSPMLTQHARDRMRQRRIKFAHLSRTWYFGTEYAVGGGRVALVHGRTAALREHRDTGVRSQPLNIAAVLDRNGMVVTVHRVNHLPCHWQPMG